MGGGRVGSVRWTARVLTVLGLALLLAGALAGWVAPRLALGWAAAAHEHIAGSGIDVGGYLGADITALAVIIAVVIGFNATTLQIAGQTHSLALVRVILLSLTPFLLCWSVTTGVALLYFLAPPVYVAQLWQMLGWFAAVVALMVAYLWDLPWRISGQYVGLWAIRAMRTQPIARWESLDSYSAVQTAVAQASTRGDLGTVRAITTVLGRFLADVRDAKAESKPEYDRERYRALKNLLSGCAQNAGEAPNAVAYYLGYVQAGVLLQAVAVGLELDADHDLFSGVLRALKGSPERLNPLWTGMRHALCRGDDATPPYLLRFWLEHARWTADDPRRLARVAEGLAWIHAAYWRELRATATPSDAQTEAAQMLIDLYRYIAIHLARRVVRERHAAGGTVRLPDLPLSLLDRVHTAALRAWPEDDSNGVRVTVVNAYETYRKQLSAAVGVMR